MIFAAFFDDAALFPPGDAQMDVAVKAHLTRRDQPDGRYVGPFVCPVTRVDELADALGGRSIEVAVVGSAPGDVPAGIDVVALELTGPVTAVPADVRVFVECPWDAPLEVPDGAMPKLRCGGAQVPSSCQLGGAIEHCVDRDLPFKLTAGLHHAVRTTREHGFVNVLAAVSAALDGGDPVPLLLEDDPAALTISDPVAVRRLCRSIGTCSIDEPLSELRELGLIA
jgi:hypothetical protein